MWSRKFASCIVCGTNSAPHMAKGKCRRCYLKEYRENPSNVERIRENKRRWYLSEDRTEKNREIRERRHYDGKRREALERAGYACERCGSTDKLVVHHKDGNGRGRSLPNNSLDNLEVLCRRCHAREHSTADGWSRNHSRCRDCGTAEIPHNARGLCRNCYARWYNKKQIPW